jgi:hypothetical protein
MDQKSRTPNPGPEREGELTPKQPDAANRSRRFTGLRKQNQRAAEIIILPAIRPSVAGIFWVFVSMILMTGLHP